MDKLKYNKILKKYKKKNNYMTNFLKAFLSGGIIGASCEVIYKLFYELNLLKPDNVEKIITLFLILITSFLTGVGIFDKFITKFRSGLIIPTTGFSHSVSSSLIDFKKEGYIKGFGSNIFSLAGSVILYSIFISFILVIIKVILC